MRSMWQRLRLSCSWIYLDIDMYVGGYWRIIGELLTEFESSISGS